MNLETCLSCFSDLLSQKMDEGVFSAYSFLVGNLADDLPKVIIESEVEPIFDLASLTKALVTTPLVHLGFPCLLRRPIKEIGFPAGSFSEQIVKSNLGFFETTSLSHLLSHTSSLKSWANLWISCGKSVDNPRIRFLQNFASYQCGTHGTYEYSDLGFQLLGFFLEDYFSNSLDQLFELFCEKHLAQKPNLEFSGSLKKLGKETGFCSVRKRVLRGEVHDENCSALAQVSGHAGLFGSSVGVSDYLKGLFSSEGGELLRRNLLNQAGPYEGRLGWDKGDGTASEFAAAKSLGHLGFTGTCFWLDFESGNYHILLTNRVMSSRMNKDFRKIRQMAASTAQKICEQH